LRQLGPSIAADGLIEPIVVRPQKKGRLELIAGERKLRTIREYTDMDDIQAKIVITDDLKAKGFRGIVE
jgi:ParB-like chromosome segregation protein Spo0J